MHRFKYYFFILLILSTSCSESTGHIEIAWDREACEKCRMLISDRHFAVQVRGSPKNKVFLFDDIGCALHWLNAQSWQAKELWVMDYETGHWLDARMAYYVPNQKTPMDYGFGATATAVKNSLDFETAKKQILSTPVHHRQKLPQ